MNTSANLATKSDFRSNKSGTQGNWRGSNFRGGRGIGRSKPICQVCNKIRHIAVNCFYRYNKSYTTSSYHNVANNKRENDSAFIAQAMNGTLIVELAIM